MGRLRSPSLFWTFAVSFLLVLIAVAVLQGIAVVAVVGPLARHWTEDRAALLLQRTAAELRRLPPPVDERAIVATLRAARGPDNPVGLAFLADDGRILSERGSRPGRGGGPGAGPGFEGELRGLRRPPGDPPPARRRFAVASRLAVAADNGVRGELVAFSPAPRFPLGPLDAPGPLFLFLPLALLVAGAGGLVLFRVVVRRLRRLETLATRVAEGDYGARVEDGGGDEIGRLAERLNRMTAQLAAQRDSVEGSDRQRRRLLADISHELGTPLTSVRGYAETLLDPAVEVSVEERQAYLRDILEEAKRLDLLIQDLFELTRLEGGGMALVREPLDFAALCRNTALRLEPRFRDAGLAVKWDSEPAPAPIVADGRRLEQVVSNLLVNALRYVPAGGTVRLALARLGDGAGARYRLLVADDGPGIPAADLPHVFDRFYRADPARGEGGSGLGLAIVKEIVLQHGGSVRAESLVPRGACFTVELPAPPGPP